MEWIKPRQSWPKVYFWLGRAVLFNIVQGLCIFVASKHFDMYCKKIVIFDLSHLNTVIGSILGYIIITFIYYWWHRARHESPFLWRWMHQIHHSASRLEVLTAFYKHPVEILANALLSSFILYGLLGLSEMASGIAIMLTSLAELFYHWNIKTPHWLGYLVQRPESHCLHHERNRHNRNYSDLPLWDILFGTFENPKALEFTCGFAPNRELQVKYMLLGKDVHARN